MYHVFFFKSCLLECHRADVKQNLTHKVMPKPPICVNCMHTKPISVLIPQFKIETNLNMQTRCHLVMGDILRQDTWSITHWPLGDLNEILDN